jgi:RNA polymerase sigma-70 factor (ECF subfamily)
MVCWFREVQTMQQLALKRDDRSARFMTKPLVNADDAELIRLMLAGDSAAFGLLYDRLQGGIYRFALRMSSSEAFAEDITQDVFLALMRDGHQYDPDRGTLSAYLYGIARNRILKRLAKERTFVSMTSQEPDGDTYEDLLVAPDNPLLDLSRHETVEVVRQAIGALPVHYREVVLLCNLHELNYEQAASVIGCAVGTVRSRLHRARLLLMDRLRTVVAAEPAVPAVREVETRGPGMPRARYAT